MWGNTFPTYISKLHRLQNKAITIVSGSSWNETANPFYKALKILPLPLLLHFSTAKFMYNHNRLRLPLQFDNYFTLTKRVHSCNTRFSSNNQRLSPRGRPWPRRRPRGHIFKSLALALASKPQVLENCPVLGSRTALFFERLKCRWKTPETSRKICEHLFCFPHLEHRRSQGEGAGGPPPPQLKFHQ